MSGQSEQKGREQTNEHDDKAGEDSGNSAQDAGEVFGREIASGQALAMLHDDHAVSIAAMECAEKPQGEDTAAEGNQGEAPA